MNKKSKRGVWGLNTQGRVNKSAQSGAKNGEKRTEELQSKKDTRGKDCNILKKNRYSKQ